MLPTNQYVDIRNGGYYVAGTRIGLDLIVDDFRNGRSPEEVLNAYRSIGSLAMVYGAFTFILEHPDAIEEYMKDQDRLWAEYKERNPIPTDMLERFHRAKTELAKKP